MKSTRTLLSARTLRQVTIALLVIGGLMLSRPAAAQTDGLVSGPMTTKELTRYADRLALTAPQQVALESFHDTYKRSYEDLRNGEIAEFAELAEGAGDGIPNRELVRQLVRDINRIETKVAFLDRHLFDQLHPMLTPDQAARLPRVRLARERARYMTRSQMLMMNQGSAIDLTEIYEKLDLDLDAETRAAADALLESYERRLTRTLGELSKGLPDMMMAIYDRLEEMGLSDIDQESLAEDPEKMREVGQAMQQVYMEVTEESRKRATDLMKVTRATYRNVAGVLPPQATRRLRNAYYRATYHEVAPIIDADFTEKARRLLEREEIAAEDRERLDAALVSAEAESDILIERLVDVVETQRAKQNPFEFDQESHRAYSKLVMEKTARGGAIWTEAGQVAAEVLGGDWYTRVDQHQPADITAVAAETGANYWASDSSIPRRTSRGDTKRVAALLELDQDERMVLDELHTQYIAKCRKLESVADLREAVSSMWKVDADNTARANYDENGIKRLANLRLRVTEELRQTDAELFENIELALATTDERSAYIRLAHAQRVRETHRTATDNGSWMFHGNAQEANVDLGDIVLELDADSAQILQTVDILDRYDERARGILMERFAAQLELQSAQEQWQRIATELQTSGVVDTVTYQELMKEPSMKLRNVAIELIELNHRTAQELESAMGSSSGYAFRRAYNTVAYPRVYADPIAVHDHIGRALQVEDLDPGQRDQLLDLAATYRPKYDGLAEKMVTILSDGGPIAITNWEEVDWEAYQERAGILKRFAFDRNELSFRAANKLRVILTEDQLTRIGGLPDGDAAVESVWY